MSGPLPPAAPLPFRTTPRAGDVEAIVRFHAVVYERDHGFDPEFEAHVEEPLRAFAAAPRARERLWIAERGDALLGCVAIVEAERVDGSAVDAAQLRWFLVAPEARGAGLGRRLLDEAIAFSRAAGYARIVLWTVDVLDAAARLYRAAGFTRVESRPTRLWGVDLAEEKYAMALDSGGTGLIPRGGADDQRG